MQEEGGVLYAPQGEGGERRGAAREEREGNVGGREEGEGEINVHLHAIRERVHGRGGKSAGFLVRGHAGAKGEGRGEGGEVMGERRGNGIGSEGRAQFLRVYRHAV